jgi:ABC-type transport system involved in Fe-S cluster assembly fused permease/ATPase subunit
MLVAPHMLQLDLHYHDKRHTHLRHVAFTLGAISVTSWYSTFLLAMFKRYLNFTFLQGLGWYIAIVLVAIVCSQVLGWYLSKKAG